MLYYVTIQVNTNEINIIKIDKGILHDIIIVI